MAIRYIADLHFDHEDILAFDNRPFDSVEEMNEALALGPELVRKPWPVCDEKALVKDEVEVALQINGKVRGRVMVPSDLTRENAEEYFRGNEEVIKLLDGKQPKKLIYVPGRLFNIVI